LEIRLVLPSDRLLARVEDRLVLLSVGCAHTLEFVNDGRSRSDRS
jgi:hypothetical protein